MPKEAWEITIEEFYDPSKIVQPIGEWKHGRTGRVHEDVFYRKVTPPKDKKYSGAGAWGSVWWSASENKDYIYSTMPGISGYIDIKTHREMIKDALREGKSVPEEILKGYPELQTNERCQIARDITKDILHEQCKTEDDKCKIAKEITEDIVSRECDYTPDREDIDDAFYNFLQKDFDEAGYYIEYVNEDANYMYFKLIDKKTNKKSRIIELSNDRLCKEVSAGRSKYLARDVIKEL